MKEKLLYTAPEAELLVVRFEENIMSPVRYGNSGQNINYGSGSIYDQGDF